jgi:phosphopantetheinyl transferase
MKRATLDFLKSRGIVLDPRDISIHSSKTDGPTLLIHSGKDYAIPYVSLSHKGNLFIAICTDRKVGIDIEDLSEEHPGLDHKSFSDTYSDRAIGEYVERLLNTTDTREIKTTLWSAREAGFKSIGTQSIESPLQVSFSIKKDSLVARHDQVERKIFIFRVNNLVCCIAI